MRFEPWGNFCALALSPLFRVGPVCGIVCVWALDVGILVRNKFLEFRKGKEME